MPVLITFDLGKRKKGDHNRLQSMFERFGWENLGGTAYRYPKLGSTAPTEDWFNCVIPPLMLLRSFAISRKLPRFTLDIQTSTGCSTAHKYGSEAKAAKHIEFESPSNAQFGERNLIDWLDSVKFPY